MGLTLKGASVYSGSSFHPLDIAISHGRIVSVSGSGEEVLQLNDRFLVPGFVDVHVHLREPGFSYKETISTGTAAAAAGGYTTVCPMPHLNPVPDSLANLRRELSAIERGSAIHVIPYGAITRGQQGEELSGMEEMAPYVVAFSDDGRGVQSDERMEAAMRRAKSLNKPIVAHCEVNSLLRGGCIHDGRWAREHGFPGISSESEWRQVERDIGLVRRTSCRYHVCHISTKESVELIRRAKAEGLPVTCETAPHYLVLCEDDLRDEGRFKMNPPLRSAADRDALRQGLLDGTIDCIATDHAPHSAEEKSRGLRGSAMGIVGLETAFPVLYSALVETGMMPLEQLIDKMTTAPRRIFGLPEVDLKPGSEADLTVLNLNAPHIIDSRRFRSLGRATPFEGRQVNAAVEMTICGGKIVYDGRDYL